MPTNTAANWPNAASISQFMIALSSRVRKPEHKVAWLDTARFVSRAISTIPKIQRGQCAFGVPTTSFSRATKNSGSRRRQDRAWLERRPTTEKPYRLILQLEVRCEKN